MEPIKIKIVGRSGWHKGYYLDESDLGPVYEVPAKMGTGELVVYLRP